MSEHYKLCDEPGCAMQADWCHAHAPVKLLATVNARVAEVERERDAYHTMASGLRSALDRVTNERDTALARLARCEEALRDAVDRIDMIRQVANAGGETWEDGSVSGDLEGAIRFRCCEASERIRAALAVKP